MGGFGTSRNTQVPKMHIVRQSRFSYDNNIPVGGGGVTLNSQDLGFTRDLL